MSYNELKQHGSTSFPIELYLLNKTQPKYEMAHHWHKNIELIHVSGGRLRVFLDNREYLLCTGDSVFVNSETVHGALPESDCEYECIVYDPEFFCPIQDECAEFVDGISHGERFMNEFHGKNSKVAKCISDTVFALKNLGTSKTKFDIISCIYTLYGALITENCEMTERVSLTGHNSRNIVKLKKVLAFIRTSFSEQITLSDMAALCDMSPKYFCAFFKKMTKKSPVEYLNSYRIEKACRMLQSSDSSVTDIAFACGFGDLSYFIKTFKKHTGQSPGKYGK